ncbi:NUDIX hydrolase, partial [Acinetobacter baumannii]
KPDRHPGGRVVTIAYCSLLNIQHHELKIHDNELNWYSLAHLKDMAFDHKEIVDSCYHWLQESIQEHPLGFKLLPHKFALREL